MFWFEKEAKTVLRNECVLNKNCYSDSLMGHWENKKT